MQQKYFEEELFNLKVRAKIIENKIQKRKKKRKARTFPYGFILETNFVIAKIISSSLSQDVRNREIDVEIFRVHAFSLRR